MTAGEPAARTALIDGATWILDASESSLQAVWGDGEQIIWSQGEPLMIYGGAGVGKSTLVQQVVLARIGVRPPTFLGLPVTSSGKTLYLALDRPKQIRRSFARMVSELDRSFLSEHLVIWDGPLPFDIGADADAGLRLREMCHEVNADTLIIDSLKDAAMELEKPAAASLANKAVQHVVADDVEVVMIHHPRKSQFGDRRPRLDDVFGGTWLTAGSGSVVLVWGKAGDAIVSLEHLKQPMEVVGPLKVVHDHGSGTSTLQQPMNLLDFVRSKNGITAHAAAAFMLDMELSELSDNEVARFRMQLNRLVKKGLAHEEPGTKGGKNGGSPSRYFASTDERTDEQPTNIPLFGSAMNKELHRRTPDMPTDERTDEQPTNATNTASDEHRPPRIEEAVGVHRLDSSLEACWLCGGGFDAYDGEMRPVCEQHK